jgi:OTU domain-containing protein 6
MGSKKNKVKKVFAPTSPPTNDTNANVIDNTTTNHHNDDHNDLVDDLLTQLDSGDQSVRRESATVLEEVRAQQTAQAAPPDKAGGNSKARFKARQVRPRFATPTLCDGDVLIP